LISFPRCVAAAGRTKASTLSLSVLVAIEMFNAYNALSEDNSLLQVRHNALTVYMLRQSVC
jgi:Ca2+-transporting ATPase